MLMHVNVSTTNWVMYKAIMTRNLVSQCACNSHAVVFKYVDDHHYPFAVATPSSEAVSVYEPTSEVLAISKFSIFHGFSLTSCPAMCYALVAQGQK